MATIKTTTVDAGTIALRHDTDPDKVAALRDSMRANGGWSGRPVVLWQPADRDYLRNMTGCHRISAAYAEGIDVVAIVIVPDNEDEEDLIEYAASVGDEDAADAMAKFDRELSDLIRIG